MSEKKIDPHTKPVEPKKEEKKSDPFTDPKNQPDVNGPPKHDVPTWQQPEKK